MLLQLRVRMNVQRIVDFWWRTYALVSVPRKGGTRIFLRVGVNILGRRVRFDEVEPVFNLFQFVYQHAQHLVSRASWLNIVNRR